MTLYKRIVSDPRRKRLLPGVAALFAGLFVLGFVFVTGRFLPCPFYSLTGWYCAGCGGARALSRLIRFDIPGALRFNTLFTLAAPFLSALLLDEIAAYALNRRLFPRINLGAPAVIAFIAIALLFAIARNVPAHPFTLLAPLTR